MVAGGISLASFAQLEEEGSDPRSHFDGACRQKCRGCKCATLRGKKRTELDASGAAMVERRFIGSATCKLRATEIRIPKPQVPSSREIPSFNDQSKPRGIEPI